MLARGSSKTFTSRHKFLKQRDFRVTHLSTPLHQKTVVDNTFNERWQLIIKLFWL
jgi:hypothetical protein